LPEELCASAERHYGVRFTSLESFLEYVLQELVSDESAALDTSEQAVLDKRLRDLGYL
jgi:hypothetical protein